MSDSIYRVQDHEGRGPYRPGFSHRWCDDTDVPHPQPFWEEFGWRIESVPGRFRRGEWGGSGFRTLDQCAAWFSPTERRRLHAFGYDVVLIGVDRILAESANQLVFARARPLTDDAVVIPWSALATPSTVGRDAATGSGA